MSFSLFDVYPCFQQKIPNSDVPSCMFVSSDRRGSQLLCRRFSNTTMLGASATSALQSLSGKYAGRRESAARAFVFPRSSFGWRRYGGFGYGHALRTLLPRLSRLGLSTDDITAVTRTNTLDLLDWYTPPPPPEIPKNYLPCSMCQTRFEPIEGEYFHKFQFVYCGVKCLRAHRDRGFKTIPDGS